MGLEHFTKYYLPKISSGLSICGSSIVLAELIKDSRSGRRVSSATRILASVSIADILASLAWFLGTWIAPSDLDYLDGTNHGSYQSCRFQGVILQSGALGVVIFNALLGVFYLLMVKGTWGEHNLRILVFRVQTAVWSLCAVMAILPLFFDMYHNQGPVCMIDSYPYNCTESWQLESPDTMETDCTAGDNAGFYRQITTLLTGGISISCCCVTFCVMVHKMRTLERRFRETTHGPAVVATNEKDKMEDQSQSSSHSYSDDEEEGTRDTPNSGNSAQRRKGSSIVAREGILYLAGYLATFAPWALSVIVYLSTGSWNGPLDRASVFLTTLQGLWNFLIFSRRRHMRTAVGRQATKWVWLSPCMDALSAFCYRNSPGKSRQGNTKLASPGPSQEDALASPPGNIEWRDSQAQHVSELGASEVCYAEPSGKWGPSQEKQTASAPLRPIRRVTEVSGLTSIDENLVDDPGISSSRGSSYETKDSAPFRPIRVISEVSGLDSIDEHSIDECPGISSNHKSMDLAPFRPIRIRSEVCAIDSIDEDHDIISSRSQISADSAPSPPRRLESQSEDVYAFNSIAQARNDIISVSADSAPSLPKRPESQSEDRSGFDSIAEALDLLSSRSLKSADSAPSLPKRPQSLSEDVSGSDPIAKAPQMLSSRVEKNADSAPSMPKRPESQAETT